MADIVKTVEKSVQYTGSNKKNWYPDYLKKTKEVAGENVIPTPFLETFATEASLRLYDADGRFSASEPFSDKELTYWTALYFGSVREIVDQNYDGFNLLPQLADVGEHVLRSWDRGTSRRSKAAISRGILDATTPEDNPWRERFSKIRGYDLEKTNVEPRDMEDLFRSLDTGIESLTRRSVKGVTNQVEVARWGVAAERNKRILKKLKIFHF